MSDDAPIIDPNLPGADLVRKGLDDLSRQVISVEALLVLVAGPRLRWLGIDVPDCPSVPRPREHALYDLLCTMHGDDAHSRYNALLRRVLSFAVAMEQTRRTEG